MKSVIATMLDLGGRGITCEFTTEDGSSPELQRDLIATKFLQGECSHLFFCDADMMFEADLCIRMLGAGKPLIGAICSARNLNTARIQEAISAGMTFNEASLFGCHWLIYLKDGQTQIAVQDGILPVDAVGFGAVLIHRAVFEKMINAGVAPEQARTNERVGGFRNFFAPFGTDGQYGGEDIAFCKRWSSIGGSVWAFAEPTIYHLGEFGYGGSYFAYLEAVNKLATLTRT
jgi:hypothetical protein